MAGRKTFFFEGLGVSSGIAIGPAYVLDHSQYQTDAYDLDDPDITAEVERFQRALELAKEEIQTIKKQVEEKIDRQQASIFDAHLLMLEDPYIVENTEKRIVEQQRNAEAVLWEVITELSERMKALGDEYFAERNHDLFDIGRRVIKFLTRINAEELPDVALDGSIIVARDLGPSETAQLTRDHVLGFCIDEGGPTSHTTIMARALGLPAIVGVENITKFIRSGDLLIIDGTKGRVILNPTPVQISHYKDLAHDFAIRSAHISQMRNLPAVSTDGVQFKILANLELPEELEICDLTGSEGIGLFRTEFMYLDRDEMPEFQDHEESYRKVLDAIPDYPVTMRTIDVGGDKLPDAGYGMAPESNPFMGMRAIRLCLHRPEIIRSQIKAILRAASGRQINIMIPMISGLREFRYCRNTVDSLLAQLKLEGVEPPSELKLGAMVEIPSAAIQAAELAREADFLSIGTNDLVQYTLAVDRVNKSVSSLYQQAHPAVIRLIKMTVDAGNAANCPVSVCGEMAADCRMVVLLAGMGVRIFSMAPNAIGSVKRILRAYSITRAEELAQLALKCSTPEEVEDLLTSYVDEELNRLDEQPLPQSAG